MLSVGSLSRKKSTSKSEHVDDKVDYPAVAEEKWDRRKKKSKIPYFYSPPKQIPVPKSKVCMNH